MQADAFLFQHLVRPGDLVVVEAPTYDRTLAALRGLGAEILAIPLQEDGIDMGALERALEAGVRPKLAHIIPNFQNPAGCTLSLAKRRRLLELAAAHGFTIFEDDLPWSCASRAPASPRCCRSTAATASCTHRPSRRRSAQAFASDTSSDRRTLIAEIRRLATGTYISPSMVAQAIVAEFCVSGDRPLDRDRQEALRERRDATCAALAGQLPGASPRPRAGTSFGSTCPTAPTSSGSRRARRNAGSRSSRAATSCSKAATAP